MDPLWALKVSNTSMKPILFETKYLTSLIVGQWQQKVMCYNSQLLVSIIVMVG